MIFPIANYCATIIIEMHALLELSLDTAKVWIIYYAPFSSLHCQGEHTALKNTISNGISDLTEDQRPRSFPGLSKKASFCDVPHVEPCLWA